MAVIKFKTHHYLQWRAIGFLIPLSERFEAFQVIWRFYGVGLVVDFIVVEWVSGIVVERVIEGS
jgi:hypothetical protein